MTLSKVIKAQEGFLHHKVAPRHQKRPKLAKKLSPHQRAREETEENKKIIKNCYV